MDAFGATTDWLRARARVSPRAAALGIDGRWWNFAELDALTSRLAGRFLANGMRAGDHVAVLLPNSLAAVLSAFALARVGAVMVPLNTRLTPAELAWQLARADCAHLLCCPRTEAQVTTLALSPRRLAMPAGATTLIDWLSDAPELPAAYTAPGGLDRLQAIVFTSGTTGYAKGAMLTFANHFWSATASAFHLGVHTGDRWLACLPLYHVGGLAILLRSCLYGTSVVLHDGFDVSAVLHSLRDEGITLVSLVPTMLGRLLQAGLTVEEAPALRLALIGGAAAPAALLDEASAAGLPLAVTYGLTEAASQVATRLLGEGNEPDGSVGRPLLFTQVTIASDDGNDRVSNTPGEIIVNGPTVFAGYYRDEAATAATLRDGRLHTGDIGYVDDAGELWLLDRRADLIVSGGENVYPAEVERILREHPAVTQVAVVGLPDPEWGQQVAAAVVLRQPGAATVAELLAHCRERLAGYKRPRHVVICDALPQTGSGKIQRRLVAEQLLAQQGETA